MTPTDKIKYKFPFEKIPTGGGIVLYGAGIVCKDYLAQLKNNDASQVLCIIDRQFAELKEVDGFKVVSPEWLSRRSDAENAEYNYIVISSFVFADEIFTQLKSFKIPSAKIVSAFQLGLKSYSTGGEDLIVSTIFKMLGKRTFSYIDIGANDPYRESNTAYLYLNGCRGVCVEPNPDLIDCLKLERSEDMIINIGIGRKNGCFSYYKFEDNVFNTFSKEFADDSMRLGRELVEKINIEVWTLKRVVESYFEGVYPDFVQIDIEGMDYEVLESCDFSRNAPTVICAETCNCDEEKMDAMMKGKGFLAFQKTVTNTIYLREDRGRLYEAV